MLLFCVQIQKIHPIFNHIQFVWDLATKFIVQHGYNSPMPVNAGELDLSR